jgi:hypothetical protein
VLLYIDILSFTIHNSPEFEDDVEINGKNTTAPNKSKRTIEKSHTGYCVDHATSNTQNGQVMKCEYYVLSESNTVSYKMAH